MNLINTTAASKNLLPSEEVVTKIMTALGNTPINIFAFSEVQLECLKNAIAQTIKNLHVPLKDELSSKDGFPAKKLTVGTLPILGYPIKLLNTFHTFGVDTDLEVKIPIKMFYDLYVQNLCDHYGVPNHKLGRKLIKSHLSRSQMLLFFKTLSQTDLLITSQRSSSQINKHLLFSLNRTFLA